MKQLISLIICCIAIIPVYQEWRLKDIPPKYKKQIKLVCRDGYLMWKYPKGHFTIPALNEKEQQVRCK